MELKKNAGGTTMLIRNKFKYTAETKKVECFKWKETVFWRSSPLDCIKYCNCETIKLH